MATTQIKNGFNGGTDDQLLVNPDGSINVNGGGSGGGNASVGLTGSTAPTSGTEIAGVDPAGNLVPVAVTSTGAIQTQTEGFSTITPGFPTQIAVSTSSTQLFAANPNRKYAHIVNNTTETIFIQFQASAALNQGIKMQPGSFYTLESTNLWLGVINAIGNTASQLIDVLEGET